MEIINVLWTVASCSAIIYLMYYRTRLYKQNRDVTKSEFNKVVNIFNLIILLDVVFHIFLR